MSKRRVVITGLGIISPIGNSIQEVWESLAAGKSGITPITQIDVEQFSVRFGGSIYDFDITEHISRKEARRMDSFIHYGIVAATQAIKDSGFEVTEENAGRIGVSIGSGIGGITGIEEGYKAYLKGGPRKVSPFFVPANIINMVSGNVSIMHGLKGPNLSIVSACSTGTHSIGDAMRKIQYGDADIMVTGGAEKTITPTGLGGFAAARALSTRNDDPAGASRPWDRDRDGFVLSEGGSILILEELEHAKARGAKIYAEVTGIGWNADAYHVTSPPPQGVGARDCMLLALKDAKVNIEEVDYINAHGTSTPVGDIAETQAVKGAFGDYAKKLVMSSTKSMTGHMLGAAGSAEAIFTILAINNQTAPPTINLENPDPECDLDYAPNIAREMKIDIAISNSFGFGGTNGTLVFRKFKD